MKVIRNYLYNLTYQLLAIILPVITIPFMSRIVGPEGLGSYALSYTYAQYFVLIGLLGLNSYASREIAFVRDDSKKLSHTFWQLLYGRTMTVGLSLVIYLVFVFIFVSPSNQLLQLIQSLAILSAFFDISWLFIGLENFKRVVIKDTAVKISGTILIFLLIKDASDVWLYALILAGTQLIGQITMWWEFPNNIHRVIPQLSDSVKHLKYSFKMFIPQIAINVYTMLDRILLGIFAGEAQVGLYDNSQRIIKILITIVTSLSTVMMPQLVNLYKNKRYEDFNQNIYKSFSFVSLLAFPMTFGLMALSANFVPWFFGPGFEGIIPMFYFGAFLMITLAWSSIFGLQVLLSIKRVKEFTIAVFIGALLNIVLNLILINKYQGIGTTIASVVAEYVGMLVMLYFIRDIISVRLLFKPIKKYFIASLLMSVLMWLVSLFLNKSIYSCLLLIVIGVVVYFLILFTVKDEMLKLIISKMYKRDKHIMQDSEHHEMTNEL